MEAKWGIAVWLVALAAGVIATPARGLLVWPQTWFGAAIALDRRLATARFLALAFVLTTAFYYCERSTTYCLFPVYPTMFSIGGTPARRPGTCRDHLPPTAAKPPHSTSTDVRTHRR